MAAIVRIVICWSDISGYMAACWRALAQTPGIELFVVAYQIGAGEQNIAFNDPIMHGLKYQLLSREDAKDRERVATIRSRLRRVALVREDADEERADIRVVVDDQYVMPIHRVRRLGCHKMPGLPG